ncbi:MAG: GNAT family N-acetyltransferase [Chitinophagaceae bacterium]
MIFSNNNITIAIIEDAASIKYLLDRAYRGESSKKGWTSETHLIAGEVRTNIEMVTEAITNQDGNMLVYKKDNLNFGCVHLKEIDQKIYLGMFAVEPDLQGGGIGREILKAAEEYTKQKKLNTIYMTVISVRKELIDWYKRNGYQETGEIIDFNEDEVTGKHLQKLKFLVLEKRLK